MNHIKTFEKITDFFDDSDVTDVKKLISHLTKIFSYYGIEYSNYYDNRKYETEFSTSGEALFDISVDTILGKHLSIHIFKNEFFYKYMLQYFKTIKGLKYNFESTTKIVYDIIGNIDDIINQISNDDFDSKYKLITDVNKFNI